MLVTSATVAARNGAQAVCLRLLFGKLRTWPLPVGKVIANVWVPGLCGRSDHGAAMAAC